jgi:phage baseplate assembly protein W
MEPDESYLGAGWSFPPVFDKTNAAIVLVTEEDDVAQSLQILLGTRVGERVLQPRFGCDLDIMLFEPITTTLVANVKDMIRTAILYFEPRIDIDNIQINTVRVEDGLVLIELQYTILATNSRYNLVFPFYLNEGAEQNFQLGPALKQIMI